MGDVALGWRLAPGMELAYRLRSTHILGADTVVREELWHYLVRRVDDEGTFTLEGHIESLDASIVSGGIPVDGEALDAALAEEWARLETEPVTLSLSLDGRIDHLEAPSWSDALPHRLLALRLPAGPVAPGSRWNDAETARAFTRLIPPGLEIDVAGTHRLERLEWQQSSRRHPALGRAGLVAELDTEAMVRPDDARIPTLDIHGTAHWNLDAGHLADRSLFVVERGGTDPEQSGSLQVELEWVNPPKAHALGSRP